MVSRAGLDRCGKSRPPPTWIRSPGRSARSQSLYRLRYPAHRTTKALYKFDELIMDGKYVYEHRINQVNTKTEPSVLNPSPVCNYGRCIQSSWIINYLQLLSVQITETWLRLKWLLQNGSSSLLTRKRVLHEHGLNCGSSKIQISSQVKSLLYKRPPVLSFTIHMTCTQTVI